MTKLETLMRRLQFTTPEKSLLETFPIGRSCAKDAVKFPLALSGCRGLFEVLIIDYEQSSHLVWTMVAVRGSVEGLPAESNHSSFYRENVEEWTVYRPKAGFMHPRTVRVILEGIPR